MTSASSIKYVTHQSIDKFKWDKCIDESLNGLIYAYSWYLDNMAKHWDALILNDYEAVMPLTWNRKYGIKYLYQPPFTQQLGIFSRNNISEQLVNHFLFAVPEHFSFAEIFLNYNNYSGAIKQHVNFILPLHDSYENTSARYKKDLIKNLKRAASLPLSYLPVHDLDYTLALYKKTYGERTPHLKDADFKRFRQVCLIAQEQNSLIVRGIFNNEKELMAVALLLHKKERIYLVQSTTLPRGRKMEANHFLLDNIIKEFSGGSRVLDFEGSAIPGIAHFYRNFGSIDQPYFFYQLNNLPWPLRLLKKVK